MKCIACLFHHTYWQTRVCSWWSKYKSCKPVRVRIESDSMWLCSSAVRQSKSKYIWYDLSRSKLFYLLNIFKNSYTMDAHSLFHRNTWVEHIKRNGWNHFVPIIDITDALCFRLSCVVYFLFFFSTFNHLTFYWLIFRMCFWWCLHIFLHESASEWWSHGRNTNSITLPCSSGMCKA